MPIEKSIRNRILRNIFFICAWLCMALMFVLFLALMGITQLLAQEMSITLTWGAEFVSQMVFLCILGLLTVAALVKEPFISSNHMSLAVNAVFLLVTSWVFSIAVWAFMGVFTELGSSL